MTIVVVVGYPEARFRDVLGSRDRIISEPKSSLCGFLTVRQLIPKSPPYADHLLYDNAYERLCADPLLFNNAYQNARQRTKANGSTLVQHTMLIMITEVIGFLSRCLSQDVCGVYISPTIPGWRRVKSKCSSDRNTRQIQHGTHHSRVCKPEQC